MESYYCKTHKGQVSMTEFAMVSVILISLLLVSIEFWNFGNMKLKENIDRETIESTVISVSDQMIKSGGMPEDWYKNTNTTVSIGLVDYDRNLNRDKIKKFVNMSYDEARNYLGISNYNFYFKVSSLESSVKYQTGKNISNPNIVVNSRRAAVLDNEIVHVDVTLWQ